MANRSFAVILTFLSFLHGSVLSETELDKCDLELEIEKRPVDDANKFRVNLIPSGGMGPYKFFVFKSENLTLAINADPFSDNLELKKGDYVIFVLDSNRCFKKVAVVI